MINNTYKVVYDQYEGYADTPEEAKEMEEKFKSMSDNENEVPSSIVKTYDDYINEIKKKRG